MDATDEKLAHRAGQGDHNAFATLVGRHERRMYGLALRMLHSPDDAADAAQEAFLRCYASLKTFDSDHSFGAWLYRIAYNHCLDILRRRRDAPLTSVSPDHAERVLQEAAASGPTVEELAIKNLSLQLLERALEALPARHRHILILRYTTDLSYKDIGHVLDLSESAVTMRLYHAKGALRAAMITLGEDADGAS